jgi:oligopeptide/dipeptide ABC transporter ATP-binding protein
MNPVLDVQSLRVHYRGAPKPAVSEISFQIGESESLAIVGESGSGKTTTAMALLRLLGPIAEISAEKIKLSDKDFLNASPADLRSFRRDLIGTVFQDPTANWNPARKIGAQVIQPFPRDEHEERRSEFIAYMERVGIDRAHLRIDQYPHNLSGGMLQRAMIAGALLGNPRLLVADEPTSALDVTVQADLIALLKDLTAERKLSMLLISHNLAVVSQIATKVIVMYSGNVVEAGSTESVLRNPRHPYTINLISSIPTAKKARKVPLYTAVAKGTASAGCPYANRCPIAMEICHSQVPSLQTAAENSVACHRHVESSRLIEVQR